MSVARLPVQHPQRPHCPACKADLPTLSGIEMIGPLGESGSLTINAVTFHVTCPCGTQLDMRKELTRK
jgi:hypothetical protein